MVGISPSIESYLGFVTTFLIKYSDYCSFGIIYIKAESIEQCRAILAIDVLAGVVMASITNLRALLDITKIIYEG